MSSDRLASFMALCRSGLSFVPTLSQTGAKGLDRELCTAEVKASLDSEQYWFTYDVDIPNAWQYLARIGGPALLAHDWPAEAVVAGEAIFDLLLLSSVDELRVYVPVSQFLVQVQNILARYAYRVVSLTNNVILATCETHRLRVEVNRLAGDPDKLVRTFEVFCAEMFCTRVCPNRVYMSACACWDWQQKVCSGGRFGPLPANRLRRYQAKGIDCDAGNSDDIAQLQNNGWIILQFWQLPVEVGYNKAILTPWVLCYVFEDYVWFDPDRNRAHASFLRHVRFHTAAFRCKDDGFARVRVDMALQGPKGVRRFVLYPAEVRDGELVWQILASETFDGELFALDP